MTCRNHRHHHCRFITPVDSITRCITHQISSNFRSLQTAPMNLSV